MPHTTPQNAAGFQNQNEELPADNDPVGTRIVIVVVAMVVVMFIIALGFLYEVAKRRPV